MHNWKAESSVRKAPGKEPSTGVGAKAFLRRFPHLAPTTQATQDKREISAAKTENVEWLMPTWSFLQLTGTSTQSLDVVAEQFGWNISRCKELLARAAEIAGIREERGRKIQRIVMLREVNGPNHLRPKMPRRMGLNLAIEHERGITALVQSDPLLVHGALRSYLQNVWRTPCIPVFRDPSQPEDAERYVQFLEKIGFSKKSLQFVHFNPAKRSHFRKQWRKALGLNWRHAGQVVYRNPPFRRNSASDRWLAIQPAFDRAQGGHMSDRLKGLHFLFVVAAIAFGHDGASLLDSALNPAECSGRPP